MSWFVETERVALATVFALLARAFCAGCWFVASGFEAVLIWREVFFVVCSFSFSQK